jgi:RNA polymerase sigma-70 factor (sigma-E family)
VAAAVEDVRPEEAVGPDFAAVFAAHRRDVYRLASLLCGNHSSAEDAAADAFARVYPHWVDGEVDDVAAYLRRAVVNQVQTGFRRRFAELRRMDRFSGDGRGPVVPEDQVADHDEVSRALRRLPPRQRAAVVLRYFNDLSEAEVAATMGTSVGTAKSHLSRGLDRLHELLEERR